MKRTFLIITIILLCTCASFAVDPKEIMDKVEELMDFETCIMSATMVNTDKMGSTSMVFTTYEKGNGDTILEVTDGPDKGQKILRLDNDIYIYYPDADEIVRLSSSGLKNSFLGSDFSYEDLTGDDDYNSRYDLTLEENQTIDGDDCYVILLKAKKSSETYQMQRVYIRVSDNLPVRFGMYSKSGKLMKVMYYTDWIEDKGIYMPGHIKVVNSIKKNSYSDITIDEITFNAEIDEKRFDKEEMAW